MIKGLWNERKRDDVILQKDKESRGKNKFRPIPEATICVF